MEGSMQAVLTFRNLWQQRWQIFSVSYPETTPDRIVENMVRARAEQIDNARRYWACPF
jgi:mannitol-1-phosphate/altronate dehydrogenase